MLTVKTTIQAPIQVVWDTFTNPKHIVHWNIASDTWECPKAESDFQIGGIFSSTMSSKDGSFRFDYSGKFTSIVENKSIEYTLGEMKEYFIDAGRKVQVFFEETPLGVNIVENFDPEEVNSNEQQIKGWQAILDNFKKYTESL